MKTNPKKFEKIIPLAQEIAQHGGRAYLVGGSVRDHVMEKLSSFCFPVKDLDLEVFKLEPSKLEEILRRYGQVDAVGQQFSVFKLTLPSETIDVAIPRRESKKGTGHRGFEVHGDPNMTIAEAAQRRDFTMNAMYMDPLTGNIEDPYFGQADLSSCQIKHVSLAFKEDSLRVLRAAQFAARFGFSIHPSTIELCKDIDLSDIPGERIFEEFRKLLLSEFPHIGISYLDPLGVYEKLFPYISKLKNCPQDPSWHPEGDVFTHTEMVVKEAASLWRKYNLLLLNDDEPRVLAVMLAALCHDFGKPDVTESNYDEKLGRKKITSQGHSEAGIPYVKQFLDTLNIHTYRNYNLRSQVLALVRHHLKPALFHRSSASDSAIRRLAADKEDGAPPELRLLGIVCKADLLGRGGCPDSTPADVFMERIKTLNVTKKGPEPILKGRDLIDLGYQPGPRMGEILKAIYEMQLDGNVDSKAYAVVWAVAKYQTAWIATKDPAYLPNLWPAEISDPKRGCE